MNLYTHNSYYIQPPRTPCLPTVLYAKYEWDVSRVVVWLLLWKIVAEFLGINVQNAFSGVPQYDRLFFHTTLVPHQRTTCFQFKVRRIYMLEIFRLATEGSLKRWKFEPKSFKSVSMAWLRRTERLIVTKGRVSNCKQVTMNELDFKLVYSDRVVHILAHLLLVVHLSNIQWNQRF